MLGDTLPLWIERYSSIFTPLICIRYTLIRNGEQTVRVYAALTGLKSFYRYFSIADELSEKKLVQPFLRVNFCTVLEPRSIFA